MPLHVIERRKITLSHLKGCESLLLYKNYRLVFCGPPPDEKKRQKILYRPF